MTTGKTLSEQVRIDASGRVKLSDEELESLLASPEVITSGGSGTINDVCTNSGDCTESSNMTSCTNSGSCDGSLNGAGHCTGGKEVPG